MAEYTYNPIQLVQPNGNILLNDNIPCNKGYVFHRGADSSHVPSDLQAPDRRVTCSVRLSWHCEVHCLLRAEQACSSRHSRAK